MPLYFLPGVCSIGIHKRPCQLLLTQPLHYIRESIYSSTAACAAAIGFCNRVTYNGGVILGLFLVFFKLF